MLDGFFSFALFVAGCALVIFSLMDGVKRRHERRTMLARLEHHKAAIWSNRFRNLPMLRSGWHQINTALAAHRHDVNRLIEMDQTRYRLALVIGTGGWAGALIMFILTRSFPLSVGASAFAGYGTFQVYRQIRFQHYFESISRSFPVAVDGLIRCLKAGFDLSRSLTIVSSELPKDLQFEFKMMIRNRNLGQSLGDAMHDLASRLQSREALFLATLISVQERTGGPLVEALQSLSAILRDRERLRQKRLVASSEARMSALILGGLPVVIALLLFATNSSYREILLNTQSGRAVLIFGLGLLATGSFVMYRMIRMPPV